MSGPGVARRPYRTRFVRFLQDIFRYTKVTQLAVVLVVLWLVASTGMFLAERDAEHSSITSFADALYWGVAAFSTAGIANSPATGLGQIIGGLWSIVGSILFFGTIVATVTTYFMRPMLKPHARIIETIEFNLEQLDDLSVDEMEILREAVNSLIVHVEKRRGTDGNDGGSSL